MDIKKLTKGNKKFRNNNFPKLQGKFGSLVENGQKPNILFIGCSDSRVVPDLIVNSKPGDMFIVRNIANFVPPYKSDNDYHGVTSAIEYAVHVLKVKDIIVCGHSHCGGCAALYDDLDNTHELQHVKKWLELGKKAKEETLAHIPYKKKNKSKILRATEKASVKHQVENLLTYPSIEKKVKKGDLKLHAWYYKIEDGTIEFYDKKSDKFKQLK